MKNIQIISMVLIICIISSIAIVQKQEQKTNIGMAVEFNDHAACAYVAEEMGWYEDEGINFTVYKSYATGMRLAGALARGDIQVAYICLSPAILAYARGVPIKIVAGTHKHGYGLVVSPEVTDIPDLKGKTIGCVREGGPADLLLNRLIMKYNLTDVRIKRMNPLNQVIALETGRIDAVFLPEHHATVADSKGFHMLIKSQDLWPDMQGSVLVVKTDLIENDPETVRKLTRVTQKATDWVNENPDNASIILANVLDTKPGVINKSMSRLDYTTEINAESVQEMIDYMMELGYIDEKIKAEDILDTRFLQEGKYEN
ncbi:MAG: ABC transporter substrate-binding protein [Methanophagales archaeon]|nr:ABC transporter substrate-binding protein [Methanophagales archaeon]